MTQEQTPAVEMRGICKRFPGLTALDQVDFTVRPGEIHALLGENGAGKSTLMKVLAGAVVPEEGTVRICGHQVPLGSPKAAIRAGLGMVYQQFKLVPSLTVLENLHLGRGLRRVRPDYAGLTEQIQRISHEFQLKLQLDAKVWQLSMGERQRVEIVRLLLFDAQVLVFDEPTTILTPQETRQLITALKRMRDAGRGIVFISHKLEEVLDLADRLSVLRRGKKVVTTEARSLDRDGLARLMVACPWDPPDRPEGPRLSPQGEPVLCLEEVSVMDDRGLLGLKDLSLELRPGEVLGVAGVAGNGQRELAEVCAGARPAAFGRVTVAGQDLTKANTAQFIVAGVGFVPEDRHGAGCVDELTLTENLLLKDYQEPRFRRGPWLNWSQARQHAVKLLADYYVQPDRPEAKAGTLSGGNLQKLLLARELDRAPKVLVAAYPLRGLDLASVSAVEQIILGFAEQGGAVLIISEDVSCLREISDRIMVLFRGHNMGVFYPEELSTEQLGLLMAGEKVS